MLKAILNDLVGTRELVLPLEPADGLGNQRAGWFTRKVRGLSRSISSPDDDRVIANPYEPNVLNIARDAKLRDAFWMKRQPCSAVDMLRGDPLALQYEDATVYHIFSPHLSSTLDTCFRQDQVLFHERWNLLQRTPI
ncbi:hypothetical protein VTJ83DRAFT_3145 [Remersonia thermophila]|uniref:Uncharacterized protein n=1 Tax=Remersonia thermophila TaxID=72144 RepID=A0ABR4DD76_9PEZI